jgi:hypothetical protein
MKDTKLLITYSSSWADEINIQCSLPMLLKEWLEICRDAKLAFAKYKSCCHRVGSNQEIDYYSYQQWLDCYSIKELTNAEYKVLKKFERVIDNNKFFVPEYYEEDAYI